jgi:hypothetical protein
MDIFHLAITKHFKKLRNSRFIRYLFTEPSACMGYLCGKILAISVGRARALNVECVKIGFRLEHDWDMYYGRIHRQYFEQQEVDLIYCTILAKKRYSKYDRLYKLTYRYYEPDGSLLAEWSRDWVIRTNTWEPQFTSWWGWYDPGHWTPGKYEVQILIDGIEVGNDWFVIDPPPPPKPPPTPAELLHQPIVRFYALSAGTSQKELRQSGIRFPQQTTHKVFCELTVCNLLYKQSDRQFSVTAQCFTVDEKLLWEDHRNWLIRSQEQGPLILWELQVHEGWSPGIYRVDILINGLDFAWGAFAIEA